jgi:hypothetical protein
VKAVIQNVFVKYVMTWETGNAIALAVLHLATEKTVCNIHNDNA